MKSHFGLKLAILYLLIMIGIFVWIMTRSGDTPIFAALIVLWPWVLYFPEQSAGLLGQLPGLSGQLAVLSGLVLPLVNVGLNMILLYIFGRIFEKITSKNND